MTATIEGSMVTVCVELLPVIIAYLLHCRYNMLVWLDESRCDDRNYRRQYGYSMCGTPPRDHRLLVTGTPYSAIPVVSLEGVNMNGERFAKFTRECVVPVVILALLLSWIMHHIQEISDIIETQAGARLCYIPSTKLSRSKPG